jgi:hypothetical protein
LQPGSCAPTLKAICCSHRVPQGAAFPAGAAGHQRADDVAGLDHPGETMSRGDIRPGSAN